jgi:hypothetical protein
MPIISITDVAHKINEVIDTKSPPTNMLMGNDAKLTTFLQRILPGKLWNKVLYSIWHG